VNAIPVPQNESLPGRPPRKVTKKPAPPEPRQEKIRAELNIERWPAMWQPSKSKTKAAVRTMERDVNMADGSRGTSKLEVGFTQFGTVTTEDQRMFYALIKQWEDSGKPGSVVFFSDRLLARLLKKSWGTNVIEAITGSLRRLRLTPFRWIRSYRRSDTPNRDVEEEIPFTILSDLKIIKRKTDGHVTNQQGYFQFDRNLLENLQTNYTKPLLLDEFFKLKSEIGQLIYTHVDLIMADKTRYERRSKDLFVDLGLGRLQFYRHASHRKQALDRALKELRGIGLSTGVLKSAAVEKTKDGKDYKVVFQKGARLVESDEGAVASWPEAAAAEAGPAVVINDYTKAKDPVLIQAEGLVGYFHKTVHNVEQHVPQPKEIGQALSLITQYGNDRSKFIIEYAGREAGETNFRIQHFGAVLSYASRAVAAFDLGRQPRSSPAVAAALPEPQVAGEPQQFERGQARLAMLTAEQYQVRYAKVQAELFREMPFLARQHGGSHIQEKMIRSRLIRELDREPMDLLPLSALKLPAVLLQIWPFIAEQKTGTNL
jgi:hypothetical protein